MTTINLCPIGYAGFIDADAVAGNGGGNVDGDVGAFFVCWTPVF